jgi:hypothetical protein
MWREMGATMFPKISTVLSPEGKPPTLFVSTLTVGGLDRTVHVDNASLALAGADIEIVPASQPGRVSSYLKDETGQPRKCHGSNAAILGAT